MDRSLRIVRGWLRGFGIAVLGLVAAVVGIVETVARYMVVFSLRRERRVKGRELERSCFGR